MTAPSEPLLSVVVTSRNDDHGGSLLRRMQTFTNHFIGQCRRHGLPAELIIVEWNPPTERPRLTEALHWPGDLGPCQVRVIEVPPEVHRRHRHAAALPLFQMIGKNVGIRRARGKFIVATNIDILFSDEMVRFILDGKLRTDRMYRADRMDVMTHVPVDASVEEQLAYCRSHYLRRNAREGTYRLHADGSEYDDPQDVFVSGGGVVPEEGFYPLERLLEEPMRWIAPKASLRVTAPAEALPFILEVEPGPAADYQPIQLHICDSRGQLVARAHVDRRQLVSLNLPLAAGQTETFFLRVPQSGPLRGLDPRNLPVALSRCAWSSEPPVGRPASHPDNYHCTVTDVGTLYPNDVAGPGDGIRFARGFFYPEPEPVERFRWVATEATLVVTPPPDAPPLLCLDVREGPALARALLDLELYDDDFHLLARAAVEGRSRLYFRLRLTPGKAHLLTLRVKGDVMALPGERRKLCYHLFRCFWSHGPEAKAGDGNGALCAMEAVSELDRDDVAAADAGIRFGRGFSALNAYQGERFRWGADRATLFLNGPSEEGRTLALIVEPGPRANFDPLDLEASAADGTVLAQGTVEGRQKVFLSLPPCADEVQVITLHACPQAPREMLRQQTFRLLSCGWADDPPRSTGLTFAVQPADPPLSWDADGAETEIWFGRGWYPLESYNGERFHWGRSGAVLQLAPRQGSRARALSLLVDPARPAGDSDPIRLQLRDAHGQVVSEVSITGKQVVRFPLPPGRTVQLHTDRQPLCNPDDPRMLSFRVVVPPPPIAPLSRGGFVHRLWTGFRVLTLGNRSAPTLGVVATVDPTDVFVAEGLPPNGADPERAPEFLHCTACGDFTLLSREQWFALRAYPEPHIFSLHIDSLFCYLAHCSGVLEEMLPPECEVYHIEHSEGSGWTPEGAAKLLKTVTAKGIPVLDCKQVFRWAAQMRQDGPMKFNGEDWGLASVALPETMLPRLVRRAA